MSNQLKIRQLHSEVLGELCRGFADDVKRANVFAVRAHGVGYDVLAHDLQVYAARMAARVARMARICPPKPLRVEE